MHHPFSHNRGARNDFLARAAEVRAEPGCIACDVFTCSGEPDRLVFVESLRPKDADEWQPE